MHILNLARLIEGEKAIYFARLKRLIKSSINGKKCNSRMTIVKDSNLSDGFRWRCKNSRCKSARSIRDQSFFSRSHLSFSTIISIIYFWCNDLTVKQTCKMLEIDKKTMVDWFRFCRDIVCWYFENEEISNEKIGGVGKIVEIDESVFSKRKYHRGRVVPQTWVFGGIDRADSNQLFMEIVPDRSQETLLEVIKT